MPHSIPPTLPLYGLILMGGKSKRMGEDKSHIHWHGLPQYEYLYRLLAPFTAKTFYSCRVEQTAIFPADTPLLIDAFPNTGPMGALRTAQKAHPNKAWLVVACDMPLIDAALLNELIQHRNAAQIATVFQNPLDSMPDPLCSIWEYSSLSILEKEEAKGKRSLRKVLINNAIELVKTAFPEKLININTPEEREKWAKKKSP